MADFQLLTLLGLGFLLGARHALDADHVAAVSTILSRQPSLRTSGFIGFCWGCGHTLVLLLVGLAVILFKITVSESLARVFELGVGVMLVGLGGSLAWSIYRERWHLHRHAHQGNLHAHLHSHERERAHVHEHWVRLSIRPMLVGMVHGLAGSAALALMTLSTVQTAWEGVAYILVFGIGSILGMVCLGMLISLPLVFSASFGRAQVALQSLAGLGSVLLGVVILLRLGTGEPAP